MIHALTWTRLPEGFAACIACPVDDDLPDYKGSDVKIDGSTYRCKDVVRLFRDPRKKRPADRVGIVVKE